MDKGWTPSAPLPIFEPCHEKPVFGVCDQVRLKRACSSLEASYSLEILGKSSIDTVLSKLRLFVRIWL